MTISAADERTFILSDEIIAHIGSFFPPPVGHNEKTKQARATLQALINVIGVILLELDCVICWEPTLAAVESAFAQTLKDVPALRAEVEAKHRAHSITQSVARTGPRVETTQWTQEMTSSLSNRSILMRVLAQAPLSAPGTFFGRCAESGASP